MKTYKVKDVLYQEDEQFNDKRYIVGSKGIAYYIAGFEVVETPDTEWSGEYEKTGNVVAVMIGDDRPFIYDIDELTEIKDGAYCHECGQVGCKSDART